MRCLSIHDNYKNKQSFSFIFAGNSEKPLTDIFKTKDNKPEEAAKPEVVAPLPITNPIVMPKTNKWSCP